MYHFTLTGLDAGRPFCDIDKQAALERGEVFAHVSYSKRGVELQLARPDLCPNCRIAWNEASKDD